MTPSEITAYIKQQADAVGLDPSLALGVAEMTGFSQNWTDGKRQGILALPNEFVANTESFKANPKAQIDAGIVKLSELGDATGNAYLTLKQYTGGDKAAFKTFMRATKLQGKPITMSSMQQAIDSLGLDMDAAVEAQKAGIVFAPEQQDIAPQPEPMQDMAQEPMPPEPAMQPIQQTEQMPDDQYQEPVITSSNKQKTKRIEMVFGDGGGEGDVPDDLLAYIEGL